MGIPGNSRGSSVLHANFPVFYGHKDSTMDVSARTALAAMHIPSKASSRSESMGCSARGTQVQVLKREGIQSVAAETIALYRDVAQGKAEGPQVAAGTGFSHRPLPRPGRASARVS